MSNDIELKSKKFVKLNNSICLKDVNFEYEKNKIILRNINLTIKKGEFLGIAGTSGVGKTTLVDIISNLYEPKSGQILIDGRLLTRNEALKIGYIPQEILLMNASIRENVALGQEDIDDMRVEDALRKALLFDFIKENFEEGIYANPFVDSTGFSQGQKQRLAIARALYLQPEILILDEATSALDMKTEEDFCQVLNSLRGKITIIAIAHRVSTIKSADRIVFMANSSIEAIDTFHNLLDNNISFQILINSDSIK